jgi:hypothetical protein
MSHRARCPDCAGGVFEGSGRCGRCDGTGINPQINSAVPQCPACRGTGVCSSCNGSGIYGEWGGDNPDIQTLFGKEGIP